MHIEKIVVKNSTEETSGNNQTEKASDNVASETSNVRHSSGPLMLSTIPVDLEVP